MFIDYFSNAYYSLKRNRARTILTMIGIAIGIASVTCILALSGGVSKLISGQIADLDGKLMVVKPGLRKTDPNALSNPVTQQAFNTSTLSEADVQVIENEDNIEAVAPIMMINGTAKTDQAKVDGVVVVATTPDFSKITTVDTISGQFLDKKTDNNTIVVGETLSLELFDTDRPVGQVMTVRGEDFTVIGVVKSGKDAINFNGVDISRAAIINFDRGKLFHQGRSQIQQINVLVKDKSKISSTRDKLVSKIKKHHADELDFSIAINEEIAKPTNMLFTVIRDVLVVIASISLLVGGIGVMNIMLVGVTERTREIGIRKAIGASDRSIVIQFLIESLLMSFVGAVMGYLLGYFSAFIISTFIYLVPVFSWTTV